MLGGAFAGILILILVIIVTGRDFGLDTIWPGAKFGASIGFVLGFCSLRIGMLLSKLLLNFSG